MSAQPSSPKPGRGRWALVGLAAVFFLPIAIAWWLNVNPGVLQDSTPSGGHLFRGVPAADEALLARVDGALTKGWLRGRWTLLTVNEGAQCRLECTNGMYNTRQTRLAVGKDIDRVQRVVVQAEVAATESRQRLLATYAADESLLAAFAPPEWFKQMARALPVEGALHEFIYLLDPEGRLVAAYRIEGDPKGLFKDLKRLLRYSKIG